MSRAILASSPDVGSSAKSTEGLRRSSMPMLTRFRSPPDTPLTRSLPTMVPLQVCSCSSLMTSPILFIFSLKESFLGSDSIAA
mmetsp:Transcript_8259/g.34688  ORF Transcript_8259/g.34688 Transcript_8259/m.34688 type:complete len:83 (-) Transcript_8259:410-658(-)